MAQQSIPPTQYFLNEYIVCCIKWGELKTALSCIQECLDDGTIQVLPVTWDQLFIHYSNQKSREAWLEGISVWETKFKRALPLLQPSTSTYLKIMELYTKLQRPQDTRNVYIDADENINRLLVSHCKRFGLDDDVEWKANTQTRFFNAHLSSLASTKQLDLVVEEYTDFLKTGTLQLAKKAALDTFHILFRVGSPDPSSPLYAKKLWQDMIQQLHLTPDYLLYSRMISLLANQAEMSEMYREATTTLSLHIGSFKRQAIDSSFISAITRIDSRKGMETLEEIRSIEGARFPLRLTYNGLIEKLQSEGHNEEAKKVSEWLQKDYLIKS